MVTRLVRATLLVALIGCRSTQELAPSNAGDVEAIRATLQELYVAFGFDAGGEPDWDTQRRIYLDGATFVPPIRPGRTPAGTDTETFLADFRSFALEGPHSDTGLYERIVDMRIEIRGGIAHAFVLFEGHLPTDEEAVTRGVDSIQLVRAGSAWRLASFTTQYEPSGLPLTLDPPQ